MCGTIDVCCDCNRLRPRSEVELVNLVTVYRKRDRVKTISG